MEDNWYETAVAAGAPHRIISVVDWTSDSPPFAAPTPSNPEPYSSSAAATYNVFSWGLNDPSLGNRSLQKEKFDALASPVGWHSLPFSSDPSFEGMVLTSQEFYRNTTTTWGNNVGAFFATLSAFADTRIPCRYSLTRTGQVDSTTSTTIVRMAARVAYSTMYMRL